MLGMSKALVAILLAVFWLPATAHCSLKAASDFVAEICGITCDHSASDTHADTCAEVEGGNYTATVALTHAPAPSLSTLVCLACIHARLLAEARPLEPPAWGKDHPQDWVPSLTFVQRAAPQPRAPSLT